jgi:glycosyltransferase involved in cell wall biosynthesis
MIEDQRRRSPEPARESPVSCPSLLSILYVGMLPPHPGGSGISWAQLLRGFARRGHKVRSLAPITAEALSAGDAFAFENSELEVHRFVVPHYYTGPNVPAGDEYLDLERREIRKRLPVLIAEERPDILIVGRETFGLHVPDLALAHGIPCVQGIRGNTTIAILDGRYPTVHADRLLSQFRKADMLISAARHMADGLRGLGFENVEVIPNAVDLAQFSKGTAAGHISNQLSLGPDDIVVAHLSNLKAVKRPLDLVLSAELALRDEPRLRYVVVGDGACRETMERECRGRQVASQFRFVGWVDYSEIPAYLDRADVVISMSESEGLSRVYLEAQASSRLLIASDIAPAREVVEDGVTGLLFRKGDVHDLAAKTIVAARDPALRREIGRRARERVQAHSVELAVDRYLTSFSTCIRQYRERPTG